MNKIDAIRKKKSETGSSGKDKLQKKEVHNKINEIVEIFV